MAALPKKKISRVRGRTRRAHINICLPKLVKCSNCNHPKPPHIACPECGFYGKKKIITTKTDKRIAKKLKADKPTKPAKTETPIKKTDTSAKKDTDNKDKKEDK